MSEQLRKPQNKNIRTFKQKEYTIHEHEQTDIKQNGDQSITKKQKQERHYQKQEIPISILDGSLDSQKKRRAKSLNPETQYARARLLNSIVDKIRQTKRSNLGMLGLTEQNMKQKLSKLQLLMKDASRDGSFRYDYQRDDKQDISSFLKNINDMPNDSSFASNLNTHHQIQSQKLTKKKNKNQQFRDDYAYNSLNKDEHTTNSHNHNQYQYDFSRKNKNQDPLFQLYSKGNRYIPDQRDEYGYSRPQTKKQIIQQEIIINNGQNKQSIERPPLLLQNQVILSIIQYRGSENVQDSINHNYNNNRNYQNLFAAQDYQNQHSRNHPFFLDDRKQMLDRPRSSQNIKFMYRSPQNTGVKRTPINLVAPQPFKNTVTPIHFPTNQRISMPAPQQNTPTIQNNYAVKLNKQASSRDGKPQQNQNTLGFSRYSRTKQRIGESCPLCGRNCNCPRAKY